MEQLTDYWWRLRNEKLNYFYWPSDITHVPKWRHMILAGYVAGVGKRWDAYRCFVGEAEGKRSLLRLRRRWENDIKMYFQEIWLMRGLNWSGLIWGQAGGPLWSLQWVFWLHKMREIFLDSWKTVSFSRRAVFLGVCTFRWVPEHSDCKTVKNLSQESTVHVVRVYSVSLFEAFERDDRFSRDLVWTSCFSMCFPKCQTF